MPHRPALHQPELNVDRSFGLNVILRIFGKRKKGRLGNFSIFEIIALKQKQDTAVEVLYLL